MPNLLEWDKSGERFFETGVSKGVLFVKDTATGNYKAGVVWNGLISVTQSPTGAEASKIYADDIPYLTLMSNEELEASIEAYTYPEEFEECDGSRELAGAPGVSIKQQKRVSFAICYQTKIGNDVNPDLGYKIHIIYGAMASPSERASESVNDSPEAATFSWDLTTTPIEVEGFKPTALLTIDSTRVTTPQKLAALEAILYGTKGEAPAADVPARLPLPAEIATVLAAAAG